MFTSFWKNMHCPSYNPATTWSPDGEKVADVTIVGVAIQSTTLSHCYYIKYHIYNYVYNAHAFKNNKFYGELAQSNVSFFYFGNPYNVCVCVCVCKC